MRIMLGLLVVLAAHTANAANVAAIGDSLVEDGANDPDWAETLCNEVTGQSCSDTGTLLVSGGQGPVYAAGTFSIRNLGKGGDRVTVEIFDRYCAHCVSGNAPGTPYDAVIFEGGVNDVLYYYSATAIWDKWKLILDDAYSRGRVVILYGMPWESYHDFTIPRDADLQAAWAYAVAWCSTRGNAICVDLGPALDVDDDGECDAGLCTDGLHWSATGSAAVGEYVAAQAGTMLMAAP